MKKTNSKVAAAECKLPLGTYTRATDRFSRERQKPTRALANQNVTSHLRQSARLGVRHT